MCCDWLLCQSPDRVSESVLLLPLRGKVMMMMMVMKVSGLLLILSCVSADNPPSVPNIYTRNHMLHGEKNILICHVSGFYPAPVNVSWTKNGVNVTEGTSINVPFPNKDGSFTQISRLEFIPQLGDIYTCTVTHPALNQPLTRIWDVVYLQ
uniref:Ig-like domain-containing protein n=1 Tax=Lates calcarifer TaxID=8187 RepID=A0A4W6C745_LATCA